MTPAVQTKNLTKVYTLDALKGRRKVVALDGLTLEIPAGHVLGVLGPNGAGKSTAIKLLLNLIRPTAGEARLFGRSPEEAEARRELGYLPENPAPYEYLTGEEFVTFSAELAGLRRASLKQRVKEVLEQVGLARFGGVQIRRYSKGMTQRVALAQALVSSPRLLILDEPTSGLDVLGRQLIRDIILSEKKKGTSILLCSHIIPDVETLCEDVAIVIGGKLVKSGTVSELMSAEGSETELTFEGVDPERLARLNPRVIQASARLVVRCAANEARGLIELAHGAGGALVSMQPIRHTLEDTFLAAMRETRDQVGSMIS